MNRKPPGQFTHDIDVFSRREIEYVYTYSTTRKVPMGLMGQGPELDMWLGPFGGAEELMELLRD